MRFEAPSAPNEPPDRGADVGSSEALRLGRAPWPAVVRGTWHLVLATVGATALFGALGTHWVGMLVVAPGLGSFFAGTVALIDSDFPGGAASRRGVVYAFVTGVVMVPFANGLVMLGPTGGVVLMALLILAPCSLGAALLASAETAGQPDVRALRELLPALSTARLMEEWDGSEQWLVGGAPGREAAAEVRELLLDELTRRDPEGAAAWLAAGGRSPSGFIRSDRDRTS